MPLKKLGSIAIAMLISICCFSQRIDIVRFNNSVSYYQGGSLSIHIKPVGVFPLKTRFTLQLLNSSGTVLNANIGSVSDFFTPLINGIIPSSTSPGNYSLKVVADSAGVVLATSPVTNSFNIETHTTFNLSTIGNPGLNNLQVSCFSLNNFFGYLNNGTSAASPTDNTFEIINYNSTYTYSIKLINHITGATTDLAVSSIFGGGALFTIPSGLPNDYYTIELITTLNGKTQTFSYIFLFNTGNTSLGNLSSENVCVGNAVKFTIDPNVIGKNYPGSLYIMDYGDGTKKDTFTHAKLLQDSAFAHNYSLATCLAQNNLNSNGVFKVDFNLFNKGIKIGTNNNCDTYIKNGNGTQKSVNTSIAPTADFTAPTPICINTAQTFINNTTNGFHGTGTTCSRDVTIRWFIKSPSNSFQSVNSSWFNNPNKDLQVPANVFNEAGVWQIKLTAQNTAGCNTVSEMVKDVCVQPVPTPNFKMNNEDSLAGCAPLLVNLTNLTTPAMCGSPTHSWQVLDANKNVITGGTRFTFTNSTTTGTFEPIIRFDSTGKYFIRYSITNSCGSYSIVKPVLVLGETNVTLPSSKRYCTRDTVLDFASGNHFPTYNAAHSPITTYNWQITGGTFTFVNSNASDRYPKIRFHDYGTYTVSVTYFNGCGAGKTVSQQIIFDQPVVANAGPDTTVCFNATSIALAGTATGTTSSVSWSSTGGGSFTNGNTPTPTYTFGGNDKTTLSVTFTYTANPVSGSSCPATSDNLIVTIRPENKITNATPRTICSGATLSYSPTASGTGSTFTYTSTVTSGAATGNTATGSGNINDVLVNASSTVDAVVTYTVTPHKDGCSGTPSSFTVTVKPQPNISSTAFTHPTTCGGGNGTITLNGLIPSTTFTVTYTKNGGSPTTVTLSSSAAGELMIPSLGAGTYTSISVSSSPNNCASNSVGPITLTDPSAPAAPTVSSNSPLCSGPGNTLNLIANSTTPGVTYSWNGPASFTSTSATPSRTDVTTAFSGTYNVTVSLNGCTSSGSVNVVINASPANPVVTTPVDYCQGATASPLQATATAGNTLNWYDAPTGGTPSSATPTPSTTTAGTVKYYVSQVNTTTTCQSGRSEIVVNIKPRPTITATATNPTSCNSATGSITISGLANNTNYTYTYSKNGTALNGSGTSTSSGTLQISSLTFGIYDNLVVTLNGCASNAVGPFTLSDPNPPATPTATANGPICAGNTLTLSASSTTNGTLSYTWTGPNNFSSTNKDATIPNATTAAIGTYNVTVTLNGCTSQAGSVAVVVNATPAAPTANSNSPVCTGDALNLTASTTFNGAVTYAWTGPNNFTSADQNPTIASAALIHGGNYSVTATATQGNCTSPARTVAVIVNPTPSITTASSTDPTNCNSATGTIELNGLTTGSAYLVSFTKNGVAGSRNITAVAPGKVVIDNLTAGVYNNIYVTIAGCTSNVVGPFTLVDPNPPATPVATSNSAVCSGSTLTLSATSATQGALTYNWSGPNGFSNAAQNPTIPSATTAASGTYSVTVTLNGCTSGAGTVAVVVNPTPPAPTVSSNSPVCTGNALNLGSSLTFAGAVTYAWTGPNSFTSTEKDPVINNVTTNAAGTYSVIATATTGNCASAPGSTTVVIHPTPSITGSSKSDPTNCNTATGSISLTGLTANVSYLVTYTENGVTKTATIPATGAGTVVIGSLPSGTYTNISVSANGCPSNVVGPFTLVDPNPPATPVATSNGPVCSGNTLTLEASTTTTGAITYAWTGPNGFINNTQNPSINNVSVAATGTYHVTATLNGCTSAAGSIAVVVNQTPAAPTVTSNSPVCTGNTLNLSSSTSFNGAITYAWNGPNGFTSALQNPTIDNVTTAAAGNYSLVITATTGNCPSAAGSATVVVNPTPAITGSSKTDPTNCNTATGTITLDGLVPATSYSVTYSKNGVPVTATISSQPSGSLTIPALTSGTYTNISVTLSGCPSNAVGPFTLVDPNPPMAPVATSNGPICSGNTLLLEAVTTTSGAVTYTWSGPNGFTNTSQNPSIANATMAANGTYSVIATLNNCTSATGTVDVVINATPPAPIVGSNTPVCTDSTLLLTSSTSFPGTVTYNWTGPNNFTSSLANPTIANTTMAEAGTYRLVLTATTGNCPSAAGTTAVIIHPTPRITATSFTHPTNCNSATGTIRLEGLTAATSYAVKYTQNGAPQTATITADASGIVTIANLPAGVYTNISVSLTGCPSNTVGPFTLVDPNPPAAPVATSNSEICSGNTLNLFATSTSSGALTFAWSGPNNFTSTDQNPVINNAPLAANGTYSVTVTLNSCTSAAGTVNVVINETPATPVVASNTPVCTGNPLNLTANTSYNGTVSWTWSGSNGFSSNLQNPFIASTTVADNGTYNVIATATTGNCPSAAGTTVAVVNPTPNISNASFTNPTNCNTPTGSIQLEGLTANTAYTVQYTFNSAPQTVNLTAAGSGTLTISNLPAGVYENISVTLTGCPSNTVGPFTLVDPNPPVMPVATSNGPLCSGNTLNLTANSATPGNLTYAWTGPNGWSSTQQSPVINNTTVAASGTYAVTVTLNNCVSPTGTIDVVINPTPATPTVSSNGPICASSTLNLTAATTSPGAIEYSWTGPNGWTSNVQNPSILNATTAATGTYTVTATATVGTCPSTPASVAVVVHPELVNKIDTTHQTICFSQPVTVTGDAPSGGNGTYNIQWQQSTDNINWVNIAGQTGQSITIIPTGSIYLRRTITSLPCVSSSLYTYVTVQPPISGNNIQQDKSICINTAAGLITGSLPVGANGIYNYEWQQSTDGGLTWNTITGATNQHHDPGVLTVTTRYRRIVTSDLCSGAQSNTSDAITITVNPDARAQWVVIKDTSCAPFHIDNNSVRPMLVPTQNSSYNWYANGIFYGTSTTVNPGYTLVAPGDSVLIKMVAVSLYGCRNDSLEHWFFTPPRPQPAFDVSDTVKCGPAAIMFTNLTPRLNNFRYAWNFGNGQTSNAAHPGSIIFQPNPTYGDTTYKVTMTVYSQCDTLTISKNITIKSKPKAFFAPDKTIGCSPLPVKFTNTSKGLNVSYLWDFGDGTTLPMATTAQVQHTYHTAVQDTFYAKLIATNECGSDTMRYAIVVSPNTVQLDFAINGNEANGCKPHDVMFINNSSGATNFRWDFGDGNILNTTRNIDTIRHTYTQTGSFTVTLFASNGCSDTTSTEVVTVFAKPVVDFAFAPSPICIGDSIQFTNQSDTITGLTWKFGDGSSTNVIHPKYRYATAGTYTVTLVGVRQYSPGNACIDSAQKTVTVLSSLPGSFTVSDSVSSCVPFTVTFTNQTYPSILTTWDFGNGRRDTGNIVTHTFNSVGTYNVRMTANTTGGCKYVMTKPIVVNGPAGSFTYDHGVICGSTPVRFQVNATGTDSIRYSFGDGKVVTTTNTTVYHTYTQGGNYIPTVTLIAGPTASCRLLILGVDTIKVDIVKAGFREAMTRSCGSTLVSYTDTSRAYAGVANWSWKFGNGNTSAVRHPQQTYTATNNYQVQLVVTSNSGCADTANKVVFVKVNNIPVISIVSDSLGCVNQPVRYAATILSEDSIGNYQWSFTNGVVSYAPTFSNYYTTTGSYNATLITSTIFGCSDTANRPIIINPTPTVKASDDKVICRGQSVQLQVTGAPVYSWGPLYGLNCYTCPNPIANPANTTAYEVAGTNSFGCTAKDTVNIRVVQPFTVRVSGKDTICIGQSTQLIASGATRYVWTPSTGLNAANIATPIASPTLTTAYTVVGYDAEGCFTDTARITVAVGEYPTIDLGPDKTLSTGTMLPLASTVTNGPITRWLWSPATDLNCSTCALPTAHIKKDITYRVLATNAYGCSATDTISIKVFCEGTQVFIPNLFTPDNDGINDILVVRGTGIKTVKNFRVFNRWGELVYERSNFSPNDPAYGWDGMVKGQKAPPDVYVYTCEVLCENDVPFVYKGNTAIIK
ncbi:PKD domain-containing protein [Aridibaculum aurantiacum]|uniref:PKD domain-containing protein n=1 Tax=Aridibaculum aurantiacum TaxID=2810307 RepID=UPI001A95EA10|nr:PKD domain-containing protein [Aridibaculum aurantiacum]